MNKKLDQFYTNPFVARKFVNKVGSLVDFNEYDNIIEPSAGCGNILELLPIDKRIGIDLEPNHDEVVEMDFFDYKFPKGKNLVIGNPPFGYKSKLAIQFFNKCAQHADTIAFIIPRSWVRWGIHNRLDRSFGLYWNCILADDSFVFNEDSYSVKCVAQLWSKHEIKNGGHENWNPTIPDKLIENINEYQLNNKCYEKPATLF